MRTLDRLQLDDAIFKNLMGQMQAKQEDLQAQYSTCLHILQDTEHTRLRLKKVTRDQESLCVDNSGNPSFRVLTCYNYLACYTA